MTRKAKKRRRQPVERVIEKGQRRPAPKWGVCDNCQQDLPIVKETGMCGPCTFGESDTLLTAGQ